MSAPIDAVMEAPRPAALLAGPSNFLRARLRNGGRSLRFRCRCFGRVLLLRPIVRPSRIVETAGLAGVRSVPAEIGGPVRRTPGLIVDAPADLAAEMRLREATPIAPPAARVAELDHACVRDGVVEAADGSIVAESLINRETPPPPTGTAVMRRLRDRRYVLLKQRWDANYGHWLVEGLPRLALVEERFALDELGFIVSAHHGAAMRAVYEDSLALFGVGRERIVEVGNEPIAVDRLIYPTPMTRHACDIAPRCVDLLEQLAARVRPEPFGHDRIYVSRNHMGRRRLVNEEEITAVLRGLGFLIVEPASLSLYRQIGLFRNAKVVIGNYGAALTNIAFAAGHPTLFALTSPLMQDDFFSTLMSLKRGRYVSLHGEAVGTGLDRDADFRIDVSRFQTLLERLI